MADRATRAISRRDVLLGLAAGTVATLLAACANARPSGSAPASATPTITPSTAPIPSAPAATPSASPTAAPTAEPDLRTKIAQMLLVGFRGLRTEDAPDTVADIAERGLGGILLFDYDAPTQRYDRNVASPDQLRDLVAGLRANASIPLLVAIDEEGGQVDRLKARYGFPATVSAAALGDDGDPDRTREAGKAIGETLAGLAIDLDLAPVVDLNVNPDNPIIGLLDRSFSSDPTVVTQQGLAFLEGLHDAGVAGSLKHFPGHGSSTGDTHLGWVDVTATWSEKELIPFREIIATGEADTVLVAHVFDSNLDATYPASLSTKVVDGMLRGDLGFEGVVITDDLQMGAIRDRFGYPTAVERAILAGCDILTIANQQVYEPDIVATTIDLIEAAVDAGRIDAARIDESWRRISALKASLGSA